MPKLFAEKTFTFLAINSSTHETKHAKIFFAEKTFTFFWTINSSISAYNIFEN